MLAANGRSPPFALYFQDSIGNVCVRDCVYGSDGG